MKKATDALVIWEHRTGEADRVISLLTPEGVLSAYARGSLKPGGRLTSATALLGYSSFELAEGKNMYTVADAEPIMRFARISADVASYSLACYFCELEKLFAPADESAAEFLSLALGALHRLSQGDRPRELIKCAFELKILCGAGFCPDVGCCSECGDDAPRDCCYDPDEGNILCARCSSRRGRAVNVPAGALAAMRYILSSPVDRAFSFNLGERSLAALSRVSEDGVRRFADHPLPTLDFYRSLA